MTKSVSQEIPAYGIFEGGGVKGIALVGALASSHSLGIRFRGVAGTSAGAVVAALYAAGYREEHELRALLLNAPLPQFLDGYSGPTPQKTTESLLQLLEGRTEEASGLLTALGSAGYLGAIKLLLQKRNRAIVKEFIDAIGAAKPLATRVASAWGVYDGNVFQEWLEGALRHRLGLTREVKFGDLPRDIDLAIVATRLDPTDPLVVYRSGEDKKLSVAGAVRRSMSIPFYFIPVVEDGALHIDGGVASNFPAWLFAKGLESERDPLPTLGFRLTSQTSIPAEAANRNPAGFIAYAKAVFNAMLWASAPLQVRAVPRLHSIELNVGDVDTFAFGLSARQREELFDNAKDRSRAKLQDLMITGRLRRDRTSEMVRSLKTLCEDFTKAIGHDPSKLVREDGLKTARASLMIETFDTGFRKVVCHFNFDGDTDGDLLLPKYSGLTGLAWLHPNQLVWADLMAVRSDYNDPKKRVNRYGMPPGAQALVRAQAKAMVAFGITREHSEQTIATVAVDTDMEIKEDAARERAEDAFLHGVNLLAPWVERLYTE